MSKPLHDHKHDSGYSSVCDTLDIIISVFLSKCKLKVANCVLSYFIKVVPTLECCYWLMINLDLTLFSS